MSLKVRLTEEMKAAMREHDKARLGVIRLILSTIKQYEVDERKVADDAVIIDKLHKMIKQRRDAHQQYVQAGRDDLAQQEQFEIEVIQTWLPQSLSEEEITTLIQAAISATRAQSPQEMGKVIAHLKPQMAGRADMGIVSAKVKQLLTPA